MSRTIIERNNLTSRMMMERPLVLEGSTSVTMVTLER